MSLSKVYRNSLAPIARAANIEVRRYRSHRIDLERTARTLLEGEPVQMVFDIGANAGHSAVAYAEQFPAATIHSFEPTPDTYKQLVAAVKHLPNVTTHELALSDSNGEVQFFTGDHHVSNSLLSSEPGAETRAISVKSATLDSFCDENAIDRIDFLKIDVEGAEPQVFAGAQRVLTEIRPRVIASELSFRGGDNGRGNGVEVISQLQERGYTLFGFYNVMYRAHFSPMTWLDGLFVRDDLPTAGL